MTNESLTEALAPWREKFPSVRVTEQCQLGHPAHDLVEASHDAGLLVVGRKERYSAVGIHIGSVAHAVLHHSKTAVAVVLTPDKARSRAEPERPEPGRMP
ncbi:universal stress protein [Streptomyces microflavus]